MPLWLRLSYGACATSAAVAAYFTTFHYVHYANENTRFHGWPVPTVIFQRENPSSPWLDFVGPTVVLAYPINVTLFAVLPSAVFLILRCQTRKTGATTNRVQEAT